MAKSSSYSLRKVIKNLPAPYSNLEVKYYPGGYRNQHFILLSDSVAQYFVACYDISLRDRVEKIEDVKSIFSTEGISTIKPLVIEGTTTIEQNGEIFKFFPFLNNIPVSRNNISKIALKNMGLLLADMHNIGKRYRNYKAPISRFPNKESFIKGKESVEKHNSSSNTKAKKYQTLLLHSTSLKETVLKSLYPKGFRPITLNALVHGDYHEKNLLFDLKLNIIAVVDWEKFEISNQSYELVRTIDYVCFTEGYSDNDYTKARTFLDSYNQKNTTTKDQLTKAYDFYLYTKCCNLWRENQLTLTNGTERLKQTTDFIKKDLETILFLQKNFNEHLNKLCSVL